MIQSISIKAKEGRKVMLEIGPNLARAFLMGYPAQFNQHFHA
jgi:hypothetical protein